MTIKELYEKAKKEGFENSPLTITLYMDDGPDDGVEITPEDFEIYYGLNIEMILDLDDFMGIED